MSEHVLLIGAYGWQHPGWLEEFYPGDLPVDWQLGYYGNEFPVVLIPASYWAQPDLSVAQWLEETDEAPVFLCEWPVEASAQRLARDGMSLLGARGLGFVIELTHTPTAAESEIHRELLATHALVFDIASLDRQAQATTLDVLKQRLSDHTYSVCWHGEPATQDYLTLGRLTLTRISAPKEPKELRRIIEANIAHSQSNRQMVLIVDGEPPDIQLIQNAGIMLDLL